MDGWEDLTDPVSTPKENDMAICSMCGGMSIFTDNQGNRRKPTPEELDEIIREDPRVAKYQMAIREAHDRINREQD